MPCCICGRWGMKAWSSRGFYDISSEGQADRGAGGNAPLNCHVSLDAMEQELDGVLEDARRWGWIRWRWRGRRQTARRRSPARSVCCRRRSQRRSRMGCASCTTTIPMSCAPWTAARRCHWSISCRLCRWRRICTGVLRGAGPCALCAGNNRIGLLHIKDGKKIRSLALCVGRRRPYRRFALPQQTAAKEWLIVENDEPSPDGLQDARRSAESSKILEK